MTPWLRPIPPDRPFHQLDRTDVHRGWRTVVGFIALLVLALGYTLAFVAGLALVVWTVTGDWLEFATTGDVIFVDDLANLTTLIGSLAILLPAVWLVTLLVNRRAIGTLSSVEGRLRWGWLLRCLIPAVGYMLVAFGVSLGIDAFQSGSDGGGRWPGWDAFWPPLLVIVLLVPFQAAAEEYIFRGWLLQAIGGFTFEGRTGVWGRRMAKVFRTAWPAILVSALPFIAGHGYSDWGPVAIGVFAVAVGWVTVRTGGLEAGIALHVVNNLTSLTLSASEGDLSITQGAVPFLDVASDIVPIVLWAWVVVWWFDHTGSKRPMKRLS